jgi:hypothetical protein
VGADGRRRLANEADLGAVPRDQALPQLFGPVRRIGVNDPQPYRPSPAGQAAIEVL